MEIVSSSPSSSPTTTPLNRPPTYMFSLLIFNLRFSASLKEIKLTELSTPSMSI